MKENIKIGLLSIIAITLLVQTYMIKKGDTLSANNQATNQQQVLNDPTQPKEIVPQLVEPAQPVVPEGPKTKITFEKTSHDFGRIKQDSKHTYKFKFKNTGEHPLTIVNAIGSCGCTVPEYPKAPIAPGGTGVITVEYSPGKQVGSQLKTVTITANTEPQETVLNISAIVEEVK